MKKKSELDSFIKKERNFTLLKCPRCGQFYDKHKPHACKEKNSMDLVGKLLPDDEHDVSGLLED